MVMKLYMFILKDLPKNGFDSVRFELPSCKIVYKDGNYTDEEIEMFRTVVERGMPSFFRWANQGGILSA